MGILRTPDGRHIVLLNEHLLGRSSQCDTRLESPDVSSRHALLYFKDGQWLVRDMGSTNGTFCDGVPIEVGTPSAIGPGAQLRFGRTEYVWLADAGVPLPALISVSDGRIVRGDSRFIAIPGSSDDGIALVLEEPNGWVLDQAGEAIPVIDGAIVQVHGAAFRFHAGRASVETAVDSSAPHIRRLHFAFAVTRDEEHVSLKARSGSREFDLGSRTHHYTMLCLARLRMRDRLTAALPESSHGWIDVDALSRMLQSTPNRVAVEVCRMRQQLSEAGIQDAVDIVERRRGSGQLRLGTGDVSEARI